MQVAVNIGPLYHLDGSLHPMSGVHHHLNSLIVALHRGCSTGKIPHEIRAFAPLGASRLLKEGNGKNPLPESLRTGIVLDTAGDIGPIALDRTGLPTLTGKVAVRWGLRCAVRAAKAYDLMHCTGPSFLPLEQYAPSCTVVTIFDMTTRTHPETHASENRASWERYFDFARCNAARIITVSEWSRREIVEMLNVPESRVQVVPSAPRLSVGRIEPGPARSALLSLVPQWGNRPFALYVGNIEPRKNLKRLIEAWAQVYGGEPSVRDYRLVLAGKADPAYQSELAKAASEAGVGESVYFTGYLSNETVNALMSACEAFVYVSRAEGFGLPPVEAMLCGAPVIAAGVTSLPEVVGEGGMLVNPDDTEEIAAALHRVLTDSSANQALREAGARRVTSFSWERIARETVQVWEQAYEERRL
ncbi:MAG: glycosyltransferase family 1 protein [Armatimonadaceae bacterium]